MVFQSMYKNGVRIELLFVAEIGGRCDVLPFLKGEIVSRDGGLYV